MTEQEERDMARRLATDSNVFDFERALEVVRRRPIDAEKLIRNRREMRKRQEERARARQQLKQTIREEFG